MEIPYDLHNSMRINRIEDGFLDLKLKMCGLETLVIGFENNFAAIPQINERINDLEDRVTGISACVCKLENDTLLHDFIKSANGRIEKLQAQYTATLCHEFSAATIFERLNLPGIKERIEKLEQTPSMNEWVNKTERRFEKLEDFAVGNGLANNVKDRHWLVLEFEKMIERIEKLESFPVIMQRNVEVEMIMEANIKNVHARIDELRVEFENKLEVDLAKWKEYYSLIPQNNKKPHKCPACQGKGFSSAVRISKDGFEIDGVVVNKNERFLHTDKCTACEGKGIVWG
jgi:hypothetical protein